MSEITINTCLEGAGPYRLIASYSHLLPLGIMIVMTIFILSRNKGTLATAFSFFMSSFGLWLIGDWITWTTNSYSLVNTFWAPLDYFDVLGFLSALYFYLVFMSGGNDIRVRNKVVIGLLTLFPLYLVVSGQSILGFNKPQCESIENVYLTYYRFGIEIFSILAIAFLGRTYYKHNLIVVPKKSFWLVTVSLILFLLTFALTGFISSQTYIYEVQLYGMFALPAFMFFIVLAITRYDVFELRYWNQGLLAWVLVPLIGSEFFFLRGVSDFILNFITLIIAFFVVYILGRNIKRENEDRARIESLNKELVSTNEKLKELDRQKTEFISVASHQLRGPLTAIKGYVSLILEGDFGAFSDNIKTAIETIYKSTQALVVIVGDYLDISRIEQGRMRYDFADFDTKEMVESIVNEFQPNIRISGLEFKTNIEPNQDLMVHADRGKLRQVVSNLIDNALKYTPRGSVTVSLERKEDKVMVAVSDTGVGIEPAVLPRLFDKFTRAPDASKTNITGTGLGLYVAKKMMEAHRGRIWAESEGKGKGARFVLELEALNVKKTPLQEKLNKFDAELSE